MMQAVKAGKRTPLKQPPLRQAGQSLRDEWHRMFEDDVMPTFLVAAVSVVLAIYEWIRAVLAVPPSPWVMTIAAAVVVAYAFIRVRRLIPKARALRLGSEGERAVADVLEQLRADGAQVFHDLEGHGFNVDHVVVCARGVYAIETKTISKPVGRDAQVIHDGDQVTVDGFTPDRDPVKQARAIARWVHDAIQESTGRDIYVRPVVVYPGWYVVTVSMSSDGLWVLSANALPKCIARQRERLTPEDVSLVACHLKQMNRIEARPTP